MFTPRPTAIYLGVLLALGAPVAANAQATPVAAAAEPATTIVVTGSRLLRDINATAPAPVSTIDAAALRAAGNTDITATLREIPALLSSGTVADSIERGAGGVGQGVLDLRGLGANRTLVLVDGRRHVSGVAGRSAVDVATIPPALIERVEVLTGGASAVYGSDAVTGVVNYVLKQNFQGFQFDAQTGITAEGDGRADSLGGTWGLNFGSGRGNATFSAGYAKEQEVLLGERSATADNGRANNSTTYLNPALRFQKGEINAASMPNFAGAFSIGGPGGIAYGSQIPTAAQFQTRFPGVTPTAAEQALIDRAASAPRRAIARQPVFAISANTGLVFRADFGFFDADINGNGVGDCNESYVGLTGFGGGGCYVTTPAGGVRIFNDGLISTGQNQFGGDGAVERTNASSLTPGSERLNLVSTGRYELSPAAELYWDTKVVRTTATSRNSYNTFFDTAYIALDNPWLPEALRADAVDAGGLLVSRDNTDFGPGISKAKRETVRLAGGSRGAVTPHLSYDLNLNYGRTDIENTFSNTVLADRFLAASDAVRAPDGRIVCRSDLDPTALAPAPFLPVFEPGFFTFTPGDGQCRPANLMRGANSVSPESVAFFTRPTTNTFKLDQTVATLSFSGDTQDKFELPGGVIGYALGLEFRQEKSQSTFSNATLGVLDNGSFIGDVSSNLNLLFDDQVARTVNSGGEFDVKEVFGEVRLPILRGAPFAHELSVEAAARLADYSTIGRANTWNLATVWAPVRDLRLRGSYSVAIRAPDIFELFSPPQATTFRPSDPCSISDINARIAAGLPNAETRRANCATALTALGLNPAIYEDPLTARFAGSISGNRDLSQEEATTWTLGFVLQPSMVPGLTLSADYYSIEIIDAIAAPTAQDIVDSCYDLSTGNQYCGLFDRRADGGFQTLRQAQVNFGRIETSGIDMSASYRFNVAGNDVRLNMAATRTERLNRYFDPINTDLVNPGLEELGSPKWSGSLSAQVARGPFTLGWRSQYIGRQAVAIAVQIETIESEFGAAGFADEMWVHNLSASYEVRKGLEVFGGASNITDEEPYLASSAYPVSGLGRSFFLGVRAKF